MKRTIFGLLLCGLVLCAVNAPAQGPGNYAGPNVGCPFWQQQMGQPYAGSASGLDKLSQALAAKQAALNAELAMENPNKGKIESLSREIGELRGKLLSAQVDQRRQLGEQGPPPDSFADQSRPYRPWHRAPNWQGQYGHGGHNGHRGWGCPGMMGY